MYLWLNRFLSLRKQNWYYIYIYTDWYSDALVTFSLLDHAWKYHRFFIRYRTYCLHSHTASLSVCKRSHPFDAMPPLTYACLFFSEQILGALLNFSSQLGLCHCHTVELFYKLFSMDSESLSSPSALPQRGFACRASSGRLYTNSP